MLNPACAEPCLPQQRAMAKNLHQIFPVPSPLVWGLMELLALAMQPPGSSSLSTGCG